MLSPEQARDLVDHFGGQRAAARAVGVPPSTLRHWLDPEAVRARMRRWRTRNPDYDRDYYWALSSFDYNRKLLMNRRYAGAARVRERNARRDEWRRAREAEISATTIVPLP